MYKDIISYLPEEILVYLRKSRSDDPLLTIEEVFQKHEAELNEWIARNLDHPIPKENYYKEVCSGESISSRPEFKKLLARIESNKIKAVLVVECSRLGRPDLEEIGKISKLFRYTNTHIITPHKIFDLNYEYDKEQFERELMRSNDYLEYFKKIQKRGIDISVKDGNYVGSIAPYGYDKTQVIIGKRKHPTLIINKDEARIVRLIFDWYGNERIGAVKICHRLNEMGIPTRNGGLWTRPTIRTILNNEHYIGKIRYYYRQTSYDVVDQQIVKGMRYNEDYLLIDGKHDAIIDEELFYRIKNMPTKISRTKTSTTLQNPLASLLYCECGKSMNYIPHRGIRRYTCDGQKYCHNASADAKEVLQAVCDVIKTHIEDLTVLSTTTDADKNKQNEEYIEFLEKRLVELENKELSLWDKFSEDGMPKTVFEKLKNRCEEEKANVEQALEDAYANRTEEVDYAERIVTLHEAIDYIMDDNISGEAKNKLLKTIIKRIDYSREPAVRLSKEEAEGKGLETKNGWYTGDFVLETDFLI